MSTSNRRISTLTIISVAVVLFTNIAVVHGADWPIYRGSKHNGITSETNWVADFPALAQSSYGKNQSELAFLR